VRRWLAERWPVLAVALVLAIPLTLALYDVVHDALVVPLARLFWLTRLVFKSIPPIFVWSYFLLIAFRILVDSLRRTPRHRGGSESQRQQRPGRMAVWARRIRMAKRGAYSRWGVGQHLSELAMRILAYTEGMNLAESRRLLETGAWEAPDEIRDYFRTAMHPIPPPRRLGLWGQFRRLLRRREEPPALQVELQEIVQYLETHLGLRGPGEQER